MCGDDSIRLAFLTNGGAGTLFLQANFILHVHEFLKGENIKIDVFGHSNALNDAVFKGQEFVSAYYDAQSRIHAMNEYDACVSLELYPVVLMKREPRLWRSVKLRNLLDRWEKYTEHDPRRKFFALRNELDLNAYILGIIKGKTGLNILDVTEELHIGRDFSLRICLQKDENAVLKRFGVERFDYITVQRGAYPALETREVPKLWPLEYYQELIALLKKRFPRMKIVQLGESESLCQKLDGVHVSLLGKTDWEDLKVLLKNAYLHVDAECGMVHLRRVLRGGSSVVLFGPTPKSFYAYDGNINIASGVCPHWCCKLTETSNARCVLKGNERNRCMKGITPSMVMNRIVEWECMKSLRENGSIPFGPTISEIEERTDSVVDEEFVKNFFQQQYIYHFEVRKIRLGDLWMYAPYDGRVMKVPLAKSPGVCYLRGDATPYAMVVREDKRRGFAIHSTDRFMSLCETLAQHGYDERHRIIINQNGQIRDGHHRASWLFCEYGGDFTVDALEISSIVVFPFDRIRRGSHVVVYGLGAVGSIYIRQMIASDYCKIAWAVDRSVYSGGYIDSETGIEVRSPSSLFEGSGQYDFVLIALGDKGNVKSVKKYLLDLGLTEEQIVYNDMITVDLEENAFSWA